MMTRDYTVAGENIAPDQRDDEEEEPDDEEGEVVARYPAGDYHAATEGDQLVIYSRRHGTRRTVST